MLERHPLDPGPWWVSSAWRPPHRPNHRGIDLAGPVGTPIRAAITGTASRGNEPGGAGWWVNISNGTTTVKSFHMSRIDIANGQHVNAGDVIGAMGGAIGHPGAGSSTGPHLHFEIWTGGRDIDPAPALAAVANVVGDIADGTTTPDQEDEMTPEQMAELKKHIDDRLEQVANADRAHMAAIRDQGVASVASVIAAAVASDETTDTRLRDELAALVRALDDAAKDRGA